MKFFKLDEQQGCILRKAAFLLRFSLRGPDCTQIKSRFAAV